jgi:predicted PurR-regulated permease PerM
LTFRAIEGGGVLLLLSVFFAYVLAPAVAALRRRVRIGPRQRPLSGAVAILLIYTVILIPGALAWRGSADRVAHWVRVTAPESVDHLFSGGSFEPLDRLIAGAPLPAGARRVLVQRVEGAIAYIERETRHTLDDMIAAAPYAGWLAVPPVLAFFLLTAAPGFQR